ncbi:MAG: hypothetical protein H8D05_00415 [FCB group bacterium]|nr:hypothetical protein [FCB group bacterium]
MNDKTGVMSESSSDLHLRFVTTGFFIIAAGLIIGTLTKMLTLTIVVFVVPCILMLIAGSPLRVLAFTLSLQIIVTLTQLRSTAIGLGLRPDEILIVWCFILWLFALPDGAMKEIKPGAIGKFILLFQFMFAIAVLRGVMYGHNFGGIFFQVRTYAGYLMYFPILWVLSYKEARSIMWKVLLIAGTVSAMVMMMKGILGIGEGVALDYATGIRVVAREPNAIAVIMLVLIGKLLKDWKNKPGSILIIIPTVVFMIGSIILSQYRGLWGGVVLGLIGLGVLNLFKREREMSFSRKIATALLIMFTLTILFVAAVSVLDFISLDDILSRTTKETGLEDPSQSSMFARISMWYAVSKELTGVYAVIGRGAGSSVTFFLFEFGQLRTKHWIDGSFMQTALIMGITGSFALLLIYLSALRSSIRLFLRTRVKNRAGTALGIFAALLMLLFASIFSSLLTNYRFTVLWAFILAWLQTEIMLEKQEIAEESINTDT